MKNKEVENRFAGLVHLVEWGLKSKCFDLSNDVRLCNFQGSKIQKLYKGLIKKELIDDGEDMGYDIYIEIDNGFDLKWEYPYIGFLEYFDLICSLFGITFAGYIDLTNVLHISPKRNIVHHVLPIPYLETRPMINWLVENQPLSFIIDSRIKRYLKNSWQYIWEGVREGEFNRLFNAVRLYYLASTSIRFSEAIVNLVIIWEILFAPHSHSEISHQVSMNLSKFLRYKKEKRKQLYKKLKSIYSDRSKIIHGGIPKDEDRLSDYVVTSFNITAEALYKILSSPELATVFSNEKTRKDYLEDLNF